MALTLAALLAGIRARSPLFTRTRVPDKLLATYLTDAQRALLEQATQRDPGALAQVATVAFALDAANTPTLAGAGGAGALPGSLLNGQPAIAPASAGLLVEQDVTRDQGDGSGLDLPPLVLVPGFVRSSSTPTTVTKTGAAWIVNAYAGAVLVVLAGTSAGQRARITSNTATVLTLSDPLTLDATSVVEVVQPVFETTGTTAVVTRLPATTATRGHLVRLDAAGQPYVDVTTPTLVTVDAPIPLPALYHLLGGTVHFAGGTSAADPESVRQSVDLTIVGYGDRATATRTPAVYMLGEALYLIGGRETWETVVSLELRYVPVPPPFRLETDYALLPESYGPALIALGALHAAEHIEGVAMGDGVDLRVPVDRFAQRAAEQVESTLRTVGLRRRGRVSVIREVF